ncbi:MAG: flagellar hook-basal body complex protein FliE [Rhodospirillaceae bacterium]|nr:flagellar hook-basal body complex protein FliE [Rhodospirillaceae bacterium]
MKIEAETNSLLAQIRDYQAQINESRSSLLQGFDFPSTQGVGTFGSEMASAVTNALSSVNEIQENATSMGGAYLAGEDIPLTDVVLEMQKSSLAFEATLQVRNKVLEAYQQIMNMPV